MEENISQKEVPKPILRRLKEMDIGDVEYFPIAKMCNIRVYCSNLKTTFLKEFETKIERIDENKKAYKVTRLA